MLLLLVFLSACKSNTTDEKYLARVGNRILTFQDIEPSLDAASYEVDSTETLQQIVEGWIKDELIAQEAIRQGLRNDAEVQRLLAETERQVLVSAFISKLFSEKLPEPTDEEIEAYYAQNVDQLALRDDYLRVRYMSTKTLQEANEVRNLLRDGTIAGNIDTDWPQIVASYAKEPDISISLASQYFPKNILFSSAQLKATVNELSVNQISSIIEDGEGFHIIQLADNRPAGTIPELSWIKGELKQRLTIDTRKQLIARQVQRLRTEALAQEDLEIRYTDE